jgi:hypothetical protein
MERHHSGKACVIPVFLSSFDWKHAPFDKTFRVYQMTRPITQWGDRDEGFKSMFCNSQGREAIMAARAARSDQSTGEKRFL